MIDIGGNGAQKFWFGLSSETKPTPAANSVLIEGDTGKLFFANGAAWAESVNTSYPAASHAHDAAAITSGTLDAARLGSGATGTNFLRGDGTFASPPGGTEAFPVGSIFISVSSTNPSVSLGYGVWLAFGEGRVIVGQDVLDTDFDTAEETGGAKTVTLTAAQSGLPQHTHTQNAHNHQVLRERSATTGAAPTQIARTADTSSTVDTNVFTENATAVNQDAGPSSAAEAHSNVQPYIVAYMWKRTA